MAANQEVIDAINGTIVSNNVKGITADSLRNLLLLMAENSGGSGGSGEGALRVMIPMGEFVVEEGATEVDFTPETVAMIAAEIPELAEVGEEMFAHNAKVYAQLMEKVNACEGVSVIVDASKFSKVYMGSLTSLIGGGEIYGMILSEPVIVTGLDSTLDPTTGRSTEVSLHAINKETSLLAPFDAVYLNEDGSLKFVINQEETTEPTEPTE
jgi:hypothetical protein